LESCGPRVRGWRPSRESPVFEPCVQVVGGKDIDVSPGSDKRCMGMIDQVVAENSAGRPKPPARIIFDEKPLGPERGSAYSGGTVRFPKGERTG